eukprot:2470276-Rhodomonas_salina.1
MAPSRRPVHRRVLRGHCCSGSHDLVRVTWYVINYCLVRAVKVAIVNPIDHDRGDTWHFSSGRVTVLVCVCTAKSKSHPGHGDCYPGYYRDSDSTRGHGTGHPVLIPGTLARRAALGLGSRGGREGLGGKEGHQQTEPPPRSLA